jgi:hypothetical protein
MGHLQDKMDEFPMEFDRELLWQKIEKPKKGAKLRARFGALLFLLLATALLFLLGQYSAEDQISVADGNDNNLSRELKANSGQANEPGINSLSGNLAEITVPNNHKTSFENHQNVDIGNTPDKLFPHSKSGVNPDYPTQDEIAFKSPVNKHNWKQIASSISSQGNSKSESTNLIGKALYQDTPVSQKTLIQTNKSFNLSLLPVLSQEITETNKTLHFEEGLIKPFKPSSSLNRINIFAGIGKHGTQFLSTEGDASLRTELEKPQIDFHLGLSYERLLQRGIFLSIGADYSLYKDKIITAFQRLQGNKWERLDFSIYNHYHVFSANLLIGKRLPLGGFFLDFSGGAGFNFLQLQDVDYFSDAGVSVNSSEITRDYTGNTSFFFLGRAAIGKQINQRISLQTGLQYKSWVNLTNPAADIRHRIQPFSWYVACGYGF